MLVAYVKNGKRRVTAFFCGVKVGLIQKIGGECKKYAE